MSRVLFVDTHLDWSNFSVAGHVRQIEKGTSVEMIWGCNLASMKSDEPLFLSAHGSSTSSGSFKNAKSLATLLKSSGLPVTHKTLIFLTCSAAVDPKIKGVDSFALDMKAQLQGLGYKNIDVTGGRGAVVVFPSGWVSVKKKMVSLAGAEQDRLVLLHFRALDYCKLLVKDAMSNPIAPVLQRTADEVAVTLSSFYADLETGFAGYLKPKAKAFVTH
ncbi:MAG TPA: hypothetical protein VGN16_13420 [Acidobacteriaceae bacterium]|jgi:hypothetical protein